MKPQPGESRRGAALRSGSALPFTARRSADQRGAAGSVWARTSKRSRTLPPVCSPLTARMHAPDTVAVDLEMRRTRLSPPAPRCTALRDRLRPTAGRFSALLRNKTLRRAMAPTLQKLARSALKAALRKRMCGGDGALPEGATQPIRALAPNRKGGNGSERSNDRPSNSSFIISDQAHARASTLAQSTARTRSNGRCPLPGFCRSAGMFERAVTDGPN
ncbi:hypothetical protein SKAU_G00003560 [Synaphobranchus kaupii]|uniref:Uncharacterized protein n=1 Tax=Synaphobranchus kaupii TaxID=118154 RepID=A0A9Q1G9Q6_SYNKA|nr:hypothetical protein SKAU_G00003560 [Synaphobranchus kaupii]